MGKSDKLNFGEKKAKKNDFKLEIFNKIQKVFEDESQIALKSAKKPEEMNKEEKDVYYAKRKQKILGSKFYVLIVVNIELITRCQFHCSAFHRKILYLSYH